MTTADRFAALTGEQRVRLLRRLVAAGRLGDIPAVVPARAEGGPVRLSPAQEDLWVFESLYPGSAALNLCCAYHFDRPVEPAQLAAALTSVVDHHDVLRMRISGPVGDSRVDFPPTDGFVLERLDLRESDTTLDAALTAFSRRGFDLTGEPPIRGQFVTVDDARSTLVLALHHIATDWWSFDVLHTEFTLAYQAIRDGVDLPADRPPVQYADFASWQRELAAAGVFDAQLQFWRRYLDRPPAPLTVGGPDRPAGVPAAGQFDVEQIPFHLDAGTEAAVRAFARRHNATVYAVLMAAFAVLAHRLSGEPDLILGTPSANRAAQGLARTIGYVMNAVPTRWKIGADDSFVDLLARFTGDFPALLAHADVPVGRIVGALDPDRVPGRSPLFRWVFMHLPKQESVARLRRITDPQRVHTGGEHDVVGILRDTDDGIAGTLEIRTDVYPPAVVRHWADAFLVLLRDLLAAPDAPVAGAEWLAAPERARLLAAGTGRVVRPDPGSLAELVDRRAAVAPDVVAVESDETTLTYAQLSARVGRLAARLVDAGVGPERLVALALGRSVSMVVAQLAVQRAGGTYLPLDADHPADRLRYLVADAKPMLLVTDRATAHALSAGTPTAEPLRGVLASPPTADAPTHSATTNGATTRSATADGATHSAVADGATDSAVVDGAVTDSAVTDSAAADNAVTVSAADDGVLADGAAVDGAVADNAAADSAADDGAAGGSPLALGVPWLLLDDLDLTTGPVSAAVGVDPRRAGYVTYTSGSTGQPKGVVVTHTGIAALAAAFAEVFELTDTSRVLLLGSPSFDISVGELCMAFGAGCTLVVPPPGPLVGAALATVLTERRVTATLLPPGILASVPPGDFPDLRSVCVGADVCPPELVAAWARDGRRVRNAYGPTEATVAATVSDPLPGDGTVVPIGRPLIDARTYVLDRSLRPVPVGVLGELYLAGPGLARGYLGRPALTAQRFVADPYGAPGDRMYRTGDLVRWRADGQLDFVGRSDDQVKVRGVRVEPAEIEAVLARHDAVDRVVVLLRADPPGARRLVAYVVARPGVEVSPDALLAHAAAALPVQLVPAAFVVVPRLPLTANGKLDRAALPDPVAGPRPADRAPATGREAQLCALFAEVLGVPVVGVADGFFELGGDSIMAIQLVSRARAAGLGLTPRDVFAARTPGALAALARTVGAVPDGADTGAGRFPLTPVMRWWQDQDGSPEAFTMSALLRVPAGTDAVRIAAALATLTDRHAALRMRLGSSGDDLVVAAASDVPHDGAVHRVDAAGMTDAAVRTAARETAARVRIAPRQARPHAVWYHAGDRDGWLLLIVHHLAVDGVSWRILAAELAVLLGSRPADLPPPTASFRRWSTALTEHAVPAEGELPHWAATLAGTDARLLPDRPYGPRRGTLTRTVPPERAAAILTRLPAAFRCGVDAVLLTALLAAAVRWRGHGTALLIDREGHGREAYRSGDGPDASPALDVSGTVGWFTVQYPVRVESAAAGARFWHGGAAVGQALKQVKEQLRAVPSGGLGYGLLRYLNPTTAPKLAGHPAPDVRFNNLGRFTTGAPGEVDLLDAPDGGLPLGHVVELDTLTEVRADGPRLVASWSYAADAIGEAEVTVLAGYWLDALALLAAEAGAGGATSSDFPLVELSQDQIEALEDQFTDLDEDG